MISRTTVQGHYPVEQLASLVDFLDHQRRPVTESDRKSGPYPYFGANGQQGTIDHYIFNEPLVLLAEDGGHFDDPQRGIAYRIEGKTWVNNHAHVLKPKKGVDLKFLCRVLENYDVRPFVTGTTRGKLTKAGASEIPIPLPPLDKQKHIATVLDAADALRVKRRATIEKCDALVQAIFAERFNKVLTGRDRVPLATLVLEFRYGTSNKSASYGYTALRIPNVIGGRIDLSELKSVPVEKSELDRLRLRVGDLLFVRTNGNPDYVGRCAVFTPLEIKKAGYDPSDWIFASYLIRARANKERVNPVYLRAFLYTGEGRKALRERSKTSAGQFNINTENLGSIPIPLPSIELQDEFSCRITDVEQVKAYCESSLAKLESLFTSLQYRAFKGEL